jgi:urea transport system ATP-binding protein
MTNKILEIEDLTVSFDGFKAINQLNFSMDQGELRVIIGPNGAGKTTFLDVITGKVQPTEGRVLFQGKNLRGFSEHQVGTVRDWTQVSNAPSVSEFNGSRKLRFSL